MLIHVLADLLTHLLNLDLEMSQDGGDGMLDRRSQSPGRRAVAFVGLHPDQRIEPAHQGLELTHLSRQRRPEGRLFFRHVFGDDVGIDRVCFRTRQPTLRVVMNDRRD